MKNKKTNKKSSSKKEHRGFTYFKGSIDSMLEHCSKIDFNKFEDQNTPLSDDEHIEMIMEEARVTRDVAKRVFNEIKLQHITETLESLMKKGLVEIKGHDKKGEPKYGLTEKGKKLGNALKKGGKI